MNLLHRYVRDSGSVARCSLPHPGNASGGDAAGSTTPNLSQRCSRSPEPHPANSSGCDARGSSSINLLHRCSRSFEGEATNSEAHPANSSGCDARGSSSINLLHRRSRNSSSVSPCSWSEATSCSGAPARGRATSRLVQRRSRRRLRCNRLAGRRVTCQESGGRPSGRAVRRDGTGGGDKELAGLLRSTGTVGRRDVGRDAPIRVRGRRKASSILVITKSYGAPGARGRLHADRFRGLRGRPSVTPSQ
jgi:hypothetical protein